MSVMDANPPPRSDAVWPDGFRERAQAIADRQARGGTSDHLAATAQTVAQHAGEAAWRAVRAYAAANPLIPSWMLDVIDGARDAAVSAAVQSVTIRSAEVTVTDERTR